MKRTLLHAVLAAAVFLLLPGLLAPRLMLQPGPWVGFAAWWIILSSQPRAAVTKLAADRRDRFSGVAIMGATLAGQLVAVAAFVLLRPAASDLWLIVVGVLTTGVGLGLRLWAIRSLGRYFTSTVQVQSGQSVIDSGPYRWIRHPSYTGALLVAVGCPLALAITPAAAASLLLCVPAYLYRIRVEEVVLVRELGPAYSSYRCRTRALLPLIG